MACFIVSAAEAVAVTAVEKSAKKKEENEMNSSESLMAEKVTIPLSGKLKWLTYMLWGGSVLLAFEHIWHGEIVPWFPFLTAMMLIPSLARTLRSLMDLLNHASGACSSTRL